MINAGDAGKLVKLRFREGYNSREVLGFDLFLSPHDVWTGVVSSDAGGGARLVSRDHSCTRPALPDAGVAFSSAGYTGGALGGDGGPSGIGRSREGSIEVIALGDVIPGSATAERITHVQTGQPNEGEPPGCDQISASNFAADLDVPGDDLSGAAAIVNVGTGTFFPYNADALSGFTDTILYTPLAIVGPDLRSANSAEATRGVARAYVAAGKGMIALDYARGEDAVSAVFMAQMLHNEFLDAPGIGASTDWVVTFPTKPYYVDAAFSPAAPLAPFEEAFAPPGGSDVVLAADIFDQEEGATATHPPSDGCEFICPGSEPLTLPYSVNVVRILPQHTAARPSEVFGSALSTALLPFGTTPGTDLAPIGGGWVRLDLASGVHALLDGKLASDGSGVKFAGLPATGFMAYDVINANAQPGKLANYSGVFPHRSSLACTTSGTDAIPCP